MGGTRLCADETLERKGVIRRKHARNREDSLLKGRKKDNLEHLRRSRKASERVSEGSLIGSSKIFKLH